MKAKIAQQPQTSNPGDALVHAIIMLDPLKHPAAATLAQAALAALHCSTDDIDLADAVDSARKYLIACKRYSIDDFPQTKRRHHVAELMARKVARSIAGNRSIAKDFLPALAKAPGYEPIRSLLHPMPTLTDALIGRLDVLAQTAIDNARISASDIERAQAVVRAILRDLGLPPAIAKHLYE